MQTTTQLQTGGKWQSIQVGDRLFQVKNEEGQSECRWLAKDASGAFNQVSQAAPLASQRTSFALINVGDEFVVVCGGN